MKASEVFPSQYLKSSDLKGHEPTVTISNVTMEDMFDERKSVMYFQGKEKGLILNRTNWDIIEELYGEESDEWTGKQITLYVAMVTYKGKRVEGLRVRAPQKRPQVQEVPQTNAVQAVGNGKGQMKQVADVASESLRRVIQKQHATHVSSTTEPVDDSGLDDGEPIPF